VIAILSRTVAAPCVTDEQTADEGHVVPAGTSKVTEAVTTPLDAADHAAPAVNALRA
jgi:hypothetical protein